MPCVIEFVCICLSVGDVLGYILLSLGHVLDCISFSSRHAMERNKYNLAENGFRMVQQLRRGEWMAMRVLRV